MDNESTLPPQEPRILPEEGWERFWKEDELGYTAEGGFFIKSDISKFFKTLRQNGFEPVGIGINDTSTIEIFVKKKPD